MLKLDGVNWCCNGTELTKGAVDYFVDLFTKEADPLPSYRVKGKFTRLNSDEILNLDKAITSEEVKQAIFEMDPSKAAGPDGLKPISINISGLWWVISLLNLFRMLLIKGVFLRK